MGKARKKKLKAVKVNKSVKYATNPEINAALNAIATTRKGGAVNIKGLGFQLFYSCVRLLTELTKEIPNNIRLEGIEDVDVLHIGNTEYIQLKTSVKTINAGAFWDMNVLQNFIPVFKVDQSARLKVVHDFNIASGKLFELQEKVLSVKCREHWIKKLQDSEIETTGVDFEYFLSNIEFEKFSETELIDATVSSLIKEFNLNKGTEIQYLKALFFHVFEWSKKRKTVELKDLQIVFQSVTDSFSKAPINPAIQNNWIEAVEFERLHEANHTGYFDGKAARPVHIALNLPISRKKWERNIISSLNETSITVVKSSSGQGKSTLAWMCAKAFSEKGFNVYELKYCNEWENVAGITDFLETRIRIGQMPIVVVDGLNGKLEAWNELAINLAQFPVKILVTTREEDWYRFGLDESKVSLNFVHIDLSVKEAKEIFHLLKKKSKIHKSVTNWQTVWEQVKGQGLLIEYIFLLTRGQMIEERIVEQVKILSKESDAAAKLEILRLISLADVMNISIKTNSLTHYIQKTVGFNGDRGEVYKQLEKEYFIRFDQQFVEGLHQVRSHHLQSNLHQSVPIKDSFVKLLPLIEEEFIYDFFTNSPGFIPCKSERDIYFDELANYMSHVKFSQMVYAIDGLMQRETEKYWQTNFEIFNEVAENGLMELFIYGTLPFNRGDFNDLFDGLVNDQSFAFSFLVEKGEELMPYDYADSDLLRFVKNLSKYLSHNPESHEIIVLPIVKTTQI